MRYGAVKAVTEADAAGKREGEEQAKAEDDVEEVAQEKQAAAGG
jgi:hypothetical protein